MDKYSKPRHNSSISFGLTGGIGSGKSTVAKVFSILGIPVYDSDSHSKRLLISSETLKKQLVEAFGPQIYKPDGSLNKPAFADIIFNDEEALQKSNAIIWPAVKEDFLEWRARQKSDCVIQESALLFESGSHQNHKAVIVVDAPQEVRLQRVVKRDGTNRKDVLKRMQRQMPPSEKNKLADFIVKNDGIQMLLPQIFDIYEKNMRI